MRECIAVDLRLGTRTCRPLHSPSDRESVTPHRRREEGTYQVYEEVLRFISMVSYSESHVSHFKRGRLGKLSSGFHGLQFNGFLCLHPAEKYHD